MRSSLENDQFDDVCNANKFLVQVSFIQTFLTLLHLGFGILRKIKWFIRHNSMGQKKITEHHSLKFGRKYDWIDIKFLWKYWKFSELMYICRMNERKIEKFSFQLSRMNFRAELYSRILGISLEFQLKV